jgi:hypothetical protein
MHEDVNADRRRFLSIAAMTIAGARLAANGTERAQSVSARSFGELKQIDAGVLSVGYVEVGPAGGPAVYAKQFFGKYAHRLLTGGIGHNLPQEAPRAFADAIIDVDRL